MTQEQAQKYAEPIKWLAEGRLQMLTELGWRDFDEVHFDDTLESYRRKPDQSVVPWTFETLPKLPFEVVSKNKVIRCAVIEATKEDIRVGSILFSYYTLLEHYTLPDGSPCGQTLLD